MKERRRGKYALQQHYRPLTHSELAVLKEEDSGKGAGP